MPERVSHRDRRQFEWLLVREVPHLRRYAWALLGAASPAADDLVQDTLERALRKWRLWRPGGTLRSWLFRIMYRQMLNLRRSPRPDADAVSLSESLVPAVADDQQAHAELRETMAAVGRLPEPQRDALLLIAVAGMGYDEAAWILKVPVGTVRSRVSRGREALRDSWAAAPTAPPPALRRVK